MNSLSIGNSHYSLSFPSNGESGFTARSDIPYRGLPLIAQIDLRKAEIRETIAGANSFAAENFGSDRSLVIRTRSITSSAPISSRSSDFSSVHTNSTGGTSIGSLPDVIQRPNTRTAAAVTADIGEFKREREEFYVKNWDNCFAAVKQECRETDPIIYRHQLAYEELLRRWQSKSLASSRTTLPSQGAADAAIGDASSARIASKGIEFRTEPVAIRPAADPDIAGTYVRGRSSLSSYHSGTSSPLESIDELPEQERKEEDKYYDYLGRKIADDVVGDHSFLSRQGSERSLSSKRTSRRDSSLEDISPRPSSEAGMAVDIAVQPQPQPVDATGSEQNEGTQTENRLRIKRLDPKRNIKRLKILQYEPAPCQGLYTSDGDFVGEAVGENNKDISLLSRKDSMLSNRSLALATSVSKTEEETSSTSVISPSTPVYTGALLDSPDTDQQSLSDRPEPSSVSDVSTTAEIDLGTGRLGRTSRKKRATLGVALNRFSSRFLSGRPRYSRPGPRRTMTIENLDHNIRKTAARLQGHTRLPACVDEHAFSGPESRNEASFSTETETSSSGEIDEPASSMKSLSVSDADQRTSLADISATTSIHPEDRHKPPNSKRRERFRRIIASGPERRRRRFGAMLRRKKPPRNDA